MRQTAMKLFLPLLALTAGCKTTDTSTFDFVPGSVVPLEVTTDRPELAVVEWHYVLKARSQRPACFEGDPANEGMNAARLFTNLVKPVLGPWGKAVRLSPPPNVSAAYCMAELHPSNELRVRLEDPSAPQGYRTGIIHVLPQGKSLENRLFCRPHTSDANLLSCDDAAILIPSESKQAVSLSIGMK